MGLFRFREMSVTFCWTIDSKSRSLCARSRHKTGGEQEGVIDALTG